VKIRIEIETNEPSPDIASLVSTVVEQVIKNLNHGIDNGDFRWETPDGYLRLDDVSMDNALLTRLEATHARIEASDATKGSMRYVREDSGPEYRLTFMLGTTHDREALRLLSR